LQIFTPQYVRDIDRAPSDLSNKIRPHSDMLTGSHMAAFFGLEDWSTKKYKVNK